MTVLWRLFRRKYGPGLDGIGGTFSEGRWHSRGERVVYFGASAAIVVLERLAHIDPDLLPRDLQLAQFTFSGKISRKYADRFSKLPPHWPRDAAVTRGIGSHWLRETASCLLVVPSAVLPEESNYVFNPQHPEAKSLRKTHERPFAFDPRLL
jgi:RES domain-containing protein